MDDTDLNMAMKQKKIPKLAAKMAEEKKKDKKEKKKDEYIDLNIDSFSSSFSKKISLSPQPAYKESFVPGNFLIIFLEIFSLFS